ncbi:MAG: 3-isopropylmalate dehydratase large subunit, partial [Candidatus Aminicenantes bacterium]|nr:3-isopropylmalate dehydratase large subunit [Candidatus Aminicenantes bacterium]
MGKTFSEKILGLKAGKEVQAGEVVTVSPDYILSHDNSAAIFEEFKKLGTRNVKCPQKLVIILDHVVPASSEQYALNHKIIREFVAEQKIQNFFDIFFGICHQVFSENGFALPGKLILGADSHTTSYGAFGAFAAGIGRSEVASLWATDEIWLRVPETLKIEIEGKLPSGVYAKDVILKIIGEEGADRANYRAVEFTGNAIKEFSLASRLVLANMAGEIGAKNGYFERDEKDLQRGKERGREKEEDITADAEAKWEAVMKDEIYTIERKVGWRNRVE